jgi:type IV pilus assembly protein PilQ
VHGTARQINKIKNWLNQFDKPIKEVLLQAYIINIDRDVEQQLGLQWGTKQTSKAAAPEPLAFNMDLPEPANTTHDAGQFGLALAKLGQGILLHLELSALKTEGNAKIVASPRLLTANQKSAEIQTGEEIPYQQVASEGATSVAFKKAVLKLKVKPQIMPNHRIILHLKVNQDKRGAEIIAGTPAIDTQTMETQVIVADKQTLVLGGIYQKSSQKTLQRVPFIGSLPYIGRLFQYKKSQLKQRELVIFITPKIVDVR